MSFNTVAPEQRLAMFLYNNEMDIEYQTFYNNAYIKVRNIIDILIEIITLYEKKSMIMAISTFDSILAEQLEGYISYQLTDVILHNLYGLYSMLFSIYGDNFGSGHVFSTYREFNLFITSASQSYQEEMINNILFFLKSYICDNLIINSHSYGSRFYSKAAKQSCIEKLSNIDAIFNILDSVSVPVLRSYIPDHIYHEQEMYESYGEGTSPSTNESALPTQGEAALSTQGETTAQEETTVPTQEETTAQGETTVPTQENEEVTQQENEEVIQQEELVELYYEEKHIPEQKTEEECMARIVQKVIESGNKAKIIPKEVKTDEERMSTLVQMLLKSVQEQEKKEIVNPVVTISSETMKPLPQSVITSTPSTSSKLKKLKSPKQNLVEAEEKEKTPEKKNQKKDVVETKVNEVVSTSYAAKVKSDTPTTPQSPLKLSTPNGQQPNVVLKVKEISVTSIDGDEYENKILPCKTLSELRKVVYDFQKSRPIWDCKMFSSTIEKMIEIYNSGKYNDNMIQNTIPSPNKAWSDENGLPYFTPLHMVSLDKRSFEKYLKNREESKDNSYLDMSISCLILGTVSCPLVAERFRFDRNAFEKIMIKEGVPLYVPTKWSKKVHDNVPYYFIGSSIGENSNQVTFIFTPNYKAVPTTPICKRWCIFMSVPDNNPNYSKNSQAIYQITHRYFKYILISKKFISSSNDAKNYTGLYNPITQKEVIYEEESQYMYRDGARIAFTINLFQ